MSNPHVLSALREKRVHIERELADYRSRVSLATAELDALEATIHLFSSKPEKSPAGGTASPAAADRAAGSLWGVRPVRRARIGRTAKSSPAAIADSR